MRGARWTLATLSGIGAPILVAIADRVHPFLPPPTPRFAPPLLGLHLPLGGSSLILPTAAILTFVAVAALASPWTLERKAPLRDAAAGSAANLALGLLLSILPLLSAIWTLAAATGGLPPPPWEPVEGNHGPWRHLYDLRRLFWDAAVVPPGALILAGLSFLVRPSWRAAKLMLWAVKAFMLLFMTHGALVD